MSVDSSYPNFSQFSLKFLCSILSLISRNLYARTLNLVPQITEALFVFSFFYSSLWTGYFLWISLQALTFIYFDLLLSLSSDFSISHVTLFISLISVWFFITSSVSLLSFAVCFFIITIFLSSWTFMKTFTILSHLKSISMDCFYS